MDRAMGSPENNNFLAKINDASAAQQAKITEERNRQREKLEDHFVSALKDNTKMDNPLLTYAQKEKIADARAA